MSAARVNGAGGEIARMFASLAFVLANAALIVAGLGLLPSLITGDRGPHRASSIPEAEQRLGVRIVLPGYYPERLAWPPAEIRVAGGRHGSVRLVFEARGEGPGLELITATEAGEEIESALLADRTFVSSRRTAVGGHPAVLATVLLDGEAWQELSWVVEGRPVVLRTQGDLDELMRIAHSLHGRRER